LTANVILLSKYFSSAKENKKSENTEMSREGIRVNKEKKIIYFLFANDPLTFMLFLIELDISLNIIIKKNTNKPMFKYKREFKFLSLNKMKFFPINVKKVIKVIDKVKINIRIINICLFRKLSIN
tara:strand:- start:46 stop:420 length:375 start_codon:yes stop_codon:yes gene_type:complete